MVVGPGPGECIPGYETSNCRALRFRWRGPVGIRRGGAGHGRAKVGVANRTWPIQDIERDGESRIKGV